ncbi:hypothetical protein LTS08_006539 [Lithohypha guttulata]|nr:hypothetical protein LTS08_006539 [Lithohypha guttulata]
MGHGRPAKRRRLTPPVDDDRTSETIQSKELFHKAADWDLEQDYETRSRRKNTKESNKLPIKNVHGNIEQVEPELQGSDVDSDSFLGSGSEDQEDVETPPTDQGEPVPAVPLKQQLIQAQEDIARLAGLINEDPEEHAGSFKKLAQVAGENAHPSVLKLVLLSQSVVYKDAAPGYRIRAYKDEDLGSKVSKDVRRTRQYEQSLVMNYQSYVRRLVEICRDKEQESLKATALSCVCSLLLAIPHFNFRTELLNVLMHELSRKQSSIYFVKSIETLEKFFDEDEDGGPSLEAVTLLAKMMKAKDYDVRGEILDTFFHLRLLNELSVKGSTNRTDKPDDVSKLHGRRIKKEKWEHRSKKEKKIARERKAVEKDMKEADAAVDFESREKLQSETLKVVFVTYFRILKERIPRLMGSVLEGLAKFAHLINQDFFGDILEALKDILKQAEAVERDDDGQDSEGRDRMRESLLAIQTAFTLLSQQDAAKSASALHLDLSFFTSHVYRSLYALCIDPDIQLGPKSMHLPDPDAAEPSRRDNKVNVSTPVLLLTRALTAILLTPSSPPTTQAVAAFYKRLLTASLQLPEKSTKAMFALLNALLSKHSRRLEALWYNDERKGDGVFKGEAETVEGTNVFAVGSGVWEEELLRRHYCPEISEQVRAFDKVIAGLAGK